MTTDKFIKLPCDIAERRDLKASDKIVHAVLQNYQGDNGYSWPGIRTLAEKTGLARQTVLDAIQRLEATSLLEVTRRGVGKANHYKTGPETRPVQESKTGPETRPVQKPDQSRNQTSGGPETRPEPVQNSDCIKKDLLKRTNTLADMFESLWDKYPKKQAKATAEKSFQKLKPDQRLFDEIMTALERHKLLPSWQKDNGQFIPMLSTWLNQKRYDDEFPESELSSGLMSPQATDPEKAESLRLEMLAAGY